MFVRMGSLGPLYGTVQGMIFNECGFLSKALKNKHVQKALKKH